VTQDDADIIARGYDRVADAYEALESAEAPWPRLERVHAFVASLPDGSRILDLGCGNGVPATRELAARHRVTGVDISPEQIARAQSNVPGATFICGDVRHVALPLEGFDAIVALYLVDNVPREDYPTLFRRLAAWLRPNGRLLMSAEPGCDTWQTYEWLGVPMFLNTIPTEDLVDVLQEAGLRMISSERESQLEGGKPIEYAWIVAERTVRSTSAPA
jgi:cyclopropane fatty-acyl-phospholipid synthase-like methyltransferase